MNADGVLLLLPAEKQSLLYVKGVFFLRVPTFISELYWWASQYPVTQAAQEAETTAKTGSHRRVSVANRNLWMVSIDDCQLGVPSGTYS